MTEPTLEEYVNKTREDYYSGITKMMINGKASYELKGKFLDDLRNNSFTRTNGEDTVKHIESFLMIVDLLDLPNVSYERLRFAVFPISLTGEAREWLMNEPQSSVTTWVDLTKLFFRKYYPPSHAGKIVGTKAKWDSTNEGDDHEVLTNEAFSDPKETHKDGEHEIVEIFRIETSIFDFETPLCRTFNEFNYLLKIDTVLFTHGIQGAKTYEEYENKLNNDPDESWLENGVPYELIDHLCEPFHFKNGKTKWPTCSSNEDGFCNEDVSRTFNNHAERNDEEGIREERKPNDDHDIDNFDNDLVWDSTPYHTSEEEEQYKEDRCEMLRNPRQEPLIFKIRRFEMIKYSFRPAEKYIAIKECEYDDSTRTK
ncbi:hypothetical protein Tco_0198908 [Tanacetum coccineum]